MADDIDKLRKDIDGIDDELLKLINRRAGIAGRIGALKKGGAVYRPEREAPYRLAIANANVPDMLGRISHTLGKRKINIHNMLNKSKGEMAYTIVDTDSEVGKDVVDELCKTSGVLAVRYLPVDD